MTMTFKEYLIESVMGNYVSVDVDKPILIPGLDKKFPTSKICIEEQHATLMYSETTEITDTKIKQVLSKYNESFEGVLGDIEAFDSPTAPDCCAIVVKIKGETINKIHEDLKKLGLKHSYADFQPHVTLLYKLPIVEKEAAIEYVKKYLKVESIKFVGYKVEPINKTWADNAK